MSTPITFNAIPSLPHTNAGITYSLVSSGKFRVTGTSTSASLLRFIYSTTSLPQWFSFDKTYKVELNRIGTGTIRFQIYMYDSQGRGYVVLNTSADTEFKVSSSTGYVGMGVLIIISASTTVTGTIAPTLTELLEFIPRLSKTSPTNMVGNVYYAGQTGGYYALPNCTRYCFGRWWEIMQTQPAGLNGKGNAEDWWGSVTAYSKGQTPKLGAIICFADGRWSGLGHVAVLEKINSDGTYTFSNSGYNYKYFYKVTGSPSNNYGYDKSYKFQGFIYLPDEYIDSVTPDEKPTKLNKPLWFYTKRKPF